MRNITKAVHELRNALSENFVLPCEWLIGIDPGAFTVLARMICQENGTQYRGGMIDLGDVLIVPIAIVGDYNASSSYSEAQGGDHQTASEEPTETSQEG